MRRTAGNWQAYAPIAARIRWVCDFDRAVAQTCYTSAAFELFASLGSDFPEGFFRPESLEHRARTFDSSVQRKTREEYFCRQLKL